MNRRNFYSTLGKRTFDIILSTFVLVFGLPLLIIVAISILLVLGRPVFFTQARPGIKGQSFTLIKFRTMHNITNESGELLDDELRVSKFGSFLRQSSLDELPELINVFWGDMSIVGPRPLLHQYLDRYTMEQKRRHDVRPGITGLAQVSGRQLLRFSERIALDVWYVDNYSFILDLKIILKTILRVASTHGVIINQDVKDVDDLAPYKTNLPSKEKGLSNENMS